MECYRIENLTFTYPLAESPALRDVNLDVEQSEFIVICGKSGCGKSTTLYMISGLQMDNDSINSWTTGVARVLKRYVPGVTIEEEE